MADDISVTPGNGAIVAADDIGGVKHQRVKLVAGDDGSSEGDASHNNPFPVDLSAAIINALKQLVNNPSIEPASGRVRVVLDALGGAQTLGNVTTVGTVTSMSQVAGIPANSFIYDQMHMSWATSIRPRIS